MHLHGILGREGQVASFNVAYHRSVFSSRTERFVDTHVRTISTEVGATNRLLAMIGELGRLIFSVAAAPHVGGLRRLSSQENINAREVFDEISVCVQ